MNWMIDSYYQHHYTFRISFHWSKSCAITIIQWWQNQFSIIRVVFDGIFLVDAFDIILSFAFDINNISQENNKKIKIKIN